MFFGFGTMALPALTLGAVMMANAQVISETAYAADHDHLTGPRRAAPSSPPPSASMRVPDATGAAWACC